MCRVKETFQGSRQTISTIVEVGISAILVMIVVVVAVVVVVVHDIVV